MWILPDARVAMVCPPCFELSKVVEARVLVRPAPQPKKLAEQIIKWLEASREWQDKNRHTPLGEWTFQQGRIAAFEAVLKAIQAGAR